MATEAELVSSETTGERSKETKVDDKIFKESRNKAAELIDFAKAQVQRQRAKAFDSKWPTTIGEARRRETLRELNATLSSSEESVESVESLIFLEIKESIVKREIAQVKIENVQARRIWVKSLAECKAEEAAWPREENVSSRDKNTDTCTAIPPKKSPKKRKRLHRAMKIVGKFISRWCCPFIGNGN